MLSNKKILIVMSVTLLLLIFLSNIIGYSTTNYKPKYGITTTNVVFRKSPTISSSSKIRTLQTGTKLKMVGEISDFYIVELEDSEVGVVSKNYIKESSKSLENSLIYESVTKYYAIINDNLTNLRGGPSTKFTSYTKLKKGDRLEVIGKINDFLLVITRDNMVGMVKENLVTKEINNTIENVPNTNLENSNNTNNVSIIDNQNLVLNLINKARSENNLPNLTTADKLNEIATKKAEDMVNNNYFSHTSPSYGDPFKMMQNFGISYKTAGENIAGNSNITDAVNSWLSSENHKKNILSSAYNYIGIGVIPSEKYGYIIVAMFIR